MHFSKFYCLSILALANSSIAAPAPVEDVETALEVSQVPELSQVADVNTVTDLDQVTEDNTVTRPIQDDRIGSAKLQAGCGCT